MMKQRDPQIKIEREAGKFRLRAKWGSDEKRHDRILKDEAAAMWRVHAKYDLPPTKIAEFFRRDPRCVRLHLGAAQVKGKETDQLAVLKEVAGRANLTIEFEAGRSEDQGIAKLYGGQHASFCRVRVWNRSKTKAQQCTGKLIIISPGDKRRLSHYYLHWAFDDPYLPTDLARPVDILPGDYRPLDVAFAPPRSQLEVSEIPPERMFTSGRATTTILSVHDSGPTLGGSTWGCWIATHLALYTALNERPRRDQYYLPPGEHLVKVEVECEGRGDAKCFRIITPSDWRELTMEPVECVDATE